MKRLFRRGIERLLLAGPTPPSWLGVQQLESRLLMSAVAETTHVFASGGGAGDQFGQSVDLSGDLMIVGASGRDTLAGTNAGVAQIFQRSGAAWNLLATLSASDASAGDLFGTAVAIDGDFVVVTAAGDNPGTGANSGSAYVFQRSGAVWNQLIKLSASDGNIGNQFGVSVDIEGNRIIVGAFQDDDTASNVGSAYIFQDSGAGFTQTAKLTGDTSAFAEFGSSVGISGDFAVVGAHGDSNASGSNAGAAYIFNFNGTQWLRQAKLKSSDLAGFDQFGISVSIDGNTTVVGSSLDDDAGSGSGSAYVFERSGATWTQSAKLTAPDAAAGDLFGRAVAIDGNRIAVGASDDNLSGVVINSGSVYIYGRSGALWPNLSQLVASDAGTDDNLGRTVAVDENFAAGGANFDDTGVGVDAGSVYVLQLDAVQAPPFTISLSVTDAAAAETNVGQIANRGTFRITRTGSIAAAVTVGFTLTGSASNGVDYTQVQLVATIPVGKTFVDVFIAPINDVTSEGTETATLTLTPSASFGVTGGNSATLTIADNDPAGVTITVLDAVLTEGTPAADTGTVRISRTGTTTGALNVNIAKSGVALFGATPATGDYNLSGGVNAAGTIVTIPVGASFVDITLTPRDDTTPEATEQFKITLAAGVGYTIPTVIADRSVALSVADNEPQVRIEVVDNSASESGDTATFRIHRTNSTTLPLTVNFAVGALPLPGAARITDYVLQKNGVTIALNNVIIDAGQSFVDLVVKPVDNTIAEATENLTVTLLAGATYTLDPDLADRKASTEILDNEPTVSITAIDSEGAESGNSATETATFRIARNGNNSGNLTVNFTRSGTAIFSAVGDYTLSGAALNVARTAVVIPDGQSFVDVTVNPFDNVTAEPTETVILTLSLAITHNLDANAKMATVNILDNEPTVSITAIDSEGAESGNPATETATFRIARNGNNSGNLTVNFTRSGTAIFGAVGDYTLSGDALNVARTAVVIPDGQSFVDVTVNPFDNVTAEPTETVILTLSAATTHNLDANAKKATVNILDNEPTVSITAIDSEGAESGNPATETATFRIARNGNSSGNLTVNFTRSGTAIFGAVGDYTLSGAALNVTRTAVVIPDGQSFVDVTVNPFDNLIVEPTETVILSLSPATTHNLDANAKKATTDILDNEPTVTIAAIDNVGAESGNPATDAAMFRITRDGNSNGNLTVNFTRSGTALFGTAGDYTLTGNGINAARTSVVIPDGADFVDVTMTPVDNAISELSESATLTLAASPSYRLSGVSIASVGRSATATLHDNEPVVSILAIDDSSAESGMVPTDTATFRISRDLTAGNLTVNFTRAGTALFGAAGDYTLSGAGLNVTRTAVVIPDGQSFVDVTLNPVEGVLAEVTETATLNLAASKAYNLDAGAISASASILDNEPVVSIAALDNSGSESGSPATDEATFRITRTTTAGNLAVNFTRGGTALFGAAADYTLAGNGMTVAATSVIIPNGQAFVDVTVRPFDNTLAEPTESVALTLAPLATYTLDVAAKAAAVEIVDNEPIVSVAALDATASEPGADTGTFRISRAGSTAAALTVGYTVTGTAVAGTDYVNLGTLVTIPAGASFVDLTVQPLMDALTENAETVLLKLTAATTHTISSAASVAVSIAQGASLPGADLIALFASTLGGTVSLSAADVNIAFTGTIRNQGNAAAGPFAMTVFLSRDRALDAGDILFDTFNFAGLATGLNKPASGSMDPDDLTALTADDLGEYYLIIRIDGTDSVVESLETNNVYVLPKPNIRIVA